jgi:hypothetical protein
MEIPAMYPSLHRWPDRARQQQSCRAPEVDSPFTDTRLRET